MTARAAASRRRSSSWPDRRLRRLSQGAVGFLAAPYNFALLVQRQWRLILGLDPVRSGNLGYASYRFSYDSTHPEALGTRVVFDGIGRFELEGDRICRYSETFDRSMALAQQAYAPERLSRILLKYAAATKARPEWKGHLRDDEA